MDTAHVGLSEAREVIDHFEKKQSPDDAESEVLKHIKDLLQQNKKVEAVKTSEKRNRSWFKRSEKLN